MGRWIKRAVMATVGGWLWRKGKELYAAKQDEKRSSRSRRGRRTAGSRR